MRLNATSPREATLTSAALPITPDPASLFVLPGSLRRATVAVGDVLGLVAIAFCIPLVVLGIGIPIALCLRLVLWILGLLT